MSGYKEIQLDQETYIEAAVEAVKRKMSPEEFITEAVRKYLEKLKREAGEK